ncbi:hypothetical protein BSKO_03827 [Bryopsis sp. KO-2023]|nr:hypothetical protein BSKO_03827 [Bryopsis sp. KO-2023]
MAEEGGGGFLRAWAWKREHRSDKERFTKPYMHKIQISGEDTQTVLRIQQAAFKEEGFASTIWDSSIVMSKFFEKHASEFAQKRCLDLSAGCGLVGIVLAKLGAHVTSTDLGPNLSLLERNCELNAPGEIDVKEHTWGHQIEQLGGPFDLIVACDIMYIPEAVGAIVKTLEGASGSGSCVYVAHGRNNRAEEDFLKLCSRVFWVEDVTSGELDEVYQTSDVTVLRLRKRA